ncbi:hypothetical protein L6452_26422 [Arctium lappa]|uniref:Uncharacterized protein n=1 Tax=Arctium lappa TaxID=4217 RepID=A0ACB8ZUL4_ARCLA|nr:hypothetical protein L6452_26422 [Arctium lappa]
MFVFRFSGQHQLHCEIEQAYFAAAICKICLQPDLIGICIIFLVAMVSISVWLYHGTSGYFVSSLSHLSWWMQVLHRPNSKQSIKKNKEFVFLEILKFSL